LSVLVPFYERYPDHIGVLEALLRALETIGAAHKVVPARIELLKARATHHQYVETMREVEILLRLAPEEPAVLEVCAHACGVFNEKAKASELWRHLAMVADARGMRLERDRAILSLLKTDPDDEQALELGARALEQAGRAAEAATLRARREEVQSIKQRAVVRNRGPHGDAPGSTPVPVAPVAVAPESTRSLTGTMVLGDDDVLEVAEEADDTEEAIEEEEVDVAPELPMMVNPWAQSGGGSLTDAERRAGPADFDEETAEEVVSFPFVDPEQVEGLEGPIKPPAGPLRMGGAAVSSREFQVMSGTRAGPDDVTRIAQNHERLKKSGTPSQPQIQALRAASITATSEDAVPLDEISIAPPTGYIDDPFFAEEDHGADEVTSKMEALVELELRAESVRASRGVTDGRTQPASSLVADLLDDAAPRPKR
jgi:hypothetical protein